MMFYGKLIITLKFIHVLSGLG